MLRPNSVQRVVRSAGLTFHRLMFGTHGLIYSRLGLSSLPPTITLRSYLAYSLQVFYTFYR
jgi:hypothetical protein